MSLRDVCDLAYLILTEDLERAVLAERQVSAIYQASGRYKDAPLPSLHESRQRFDEDLVAEPKAPVIVDVERHELHVALGVA